MIYYDYTNVKNEDNTNEKNNSSRINDSNNFFEPIGLRDRHLVAVADQTIPVNLNPPPILQKQKQRPSSQSQKTHLLPQNRMPGRVKRTQKPNALKPQK